PPSPLFPYTTLFRSAAMNAMYASVAHRTREIATLRVLGFGRRAVLAAFLIEAVMLAVAGGALGCAAALPIHGVSTGTMNFNTLADRKSTRLNSCHDQ